MINTKRTKYRTTLTYTELKLRAVIFAMDISDVTLVPYGPGVNKDSGKRLIERVSTLNNRVKGGVSGAFVRSGVLGGSGKPTIRSLHTRTSGTRCDVRVEGALRGASRLAVERNRISRVIASRGGGVINTGAASKTLCRYGTVILYANACLETEYLANRVVARANPGKLLTTGRLARSLVSRKVRVHEFGAKAPTHMSGEDLSFSGVRRRFNSREMMPFSFAASPRDIRVSRISY